MGFFSKIKNMFKNNETTVDTKTEKVLDNDLERDEQEEVVGEKRILTEEEKKEVKVYEKGLTKSREGFVSRLAELTGRYKNVNDEYVDELEEILIMADIGVNTVMDFVDRLKKRVAREKISDPEILKEIIVDELFIIYVNDSVLINKINYNDDGPTVVLFVGVNGVGKTTTIAKIAWKLKNEGKKVLLVGADTFRVYEMFMGPFDQTAPWSMESIRGCGKFLDRVWNLQDMLVEGSTYSPEFEKRSEEHTSELQSRGHLVCRLLLEKKKKKKKKQKKKRKKKEKYKRLQKHIITIQDREDN